MRGKKTGIAVFLTVFALSFVFGMTLLGGLLQWYETCFYDKAAAIVSALPEEQLAVMQALKAPGVDELEAGRAILQRYGYRGRLLDGGRQMKTAGFVILAACLTAGAVWIILNIQDKMERHRLDGLTNFLRQVEQGIYPILSRGGEDCFSVLEDEIYKTVAELAGEQRKCTAGKGISGPESGRYLSSAENTLDQYLADHGGTGGKAEKQGRHRTVRRGADCLSNGTSGRSGGIAADIVQAGCRSIDAAVKTGTG